MNKIFLIILATLSLNAIELTKPLIMDISRTYGYVTSQSLVAEKLKIKYPEIKQELYRAQLEFDLKFKSSVENLKKSFGKEWQNYQEMMDPKLIEYVNNMNLDSTYKSGFANEILNRTKGNIESPVIETLLMFNPNYQKYPEKEFLDGFKKRLYSKDTTKAKGIDFHIDIPKSWKVKEAKRPNTLWLANDNNGYLDENDSEASFTIVIKELPERIESITSQYAKEYCDEAFKGSILKECTKTTLENLPTIYARNTMKLQRLRIEGTLEVANYIIFYENKLILIQSSVSSINNKLSQNELNKKFDKYLPLFDQIANSFVIKDLYKNKQTPETKYYLYKLFDSKFQAIFPDSPTTQDIPKELIDRKSIKESLSYKYTKDLTQKQIDNLVDELIEKVVNQQPYVYTDTYNRISYTAQSLPSGLEHENYIWNGIQKQIDELLKDALKADNRTIIDFSSNIDKYNDTYMAIYNTSYYLDGQKIYSSTKHIYYKDKIYKWSVSYINKSDKSIFDEYQHNVKILK